MVTPPEFIIFYTLLKREIMRFMRIWSQTLIPPAITMSLYFLIFGKFIGSQLQTIHHFTYMQYIVPGLVMMAGMTSAYANTSASFFLTKFNKSIEEMIVSPMSPLIMLLGFTLGGSIRGMLIGMIVLLVSFIFTHVPLVHPFIILGMGTLAVVVFSLGGLINGILAKRFDDISFIPTFVLTPLTYLGGVFYSLNQLSPFWQKAAMLNPILAMVDTFRYGILGSNDISIYYGFFLVSLLCVSLFVLALQLLKFGAGIKA